MRLPGGGGGGNGCVHPNIPLTPHPAVYLLCLDHARQAVALIFRRHAAGSCPALLRKPTLDQKSAAFQDLCVSRLGHVASRCTCSCCILGTWAIGDQAPCTCGYTCCPFPGGRGLGIRGRPSPVTRVPDSRMNSSRKRNPPGVQHLWAHPDCSS